MADHDTAGEAYQAGGPNNFLGHALGDRGTPERSRALRGLGYAVEAIEASRTSRFSPVEAAQAGHLTAKAVENGVDPMDVVQHW